MAIVINCLEKLRNIICGEVRVSDHVIDWIRGFARAFFSGFQNAASNDQRLHNIFCWYKMADGADQSVSKDIKLHLSFNE